MTIVNIILNIDSTYKNGSFCQHVLNQLNISDKNLGELSTIVVGLKKLQSNPNYAQHTEEINVFASAISALAYLTSKCVEYRLRDPIEFISRQITAKNIKDFALQLDELADLYTDKTLVVYDQVFGRNKANTLYLLTEFTKYGFETHPAILGGKENNIGMRSVNFCYVTSDANLAEILPDAKRDSGEVYPIVMTRKSPLYRNSYSTGMLFEDREYGIKIPVHIREDR